MLAFVDYLTLMLVNMAAGLVLLAWYLLHALPRPEHHRQWAAPFGAVGLVAMATGLHMSLTWPIPTPPGHAYDAAFGEMTVLFGAAFLAAALALGNNWPLIGVSIYGLVAGLAGLLVGMLIWKHQMTAMPALTFAGYLATAGGGALVTIVLRWPSRSLRWLVAGLLLAGAIIWLFTAGMGYRGHFASPDWLPQ